jgi:hypothetical protein
MSRRERVGLMVLTTVLMVSALVALGALLGLLAVALMVLTADLGSPT